MNVIAIVTHSRPECLWIHLQQLIKNPEINDYLVHFFPDYGAHPDVFKIIKDFKKVYPKNVRVTTRTEQEAKRSPLPAFYNIFDAYRIAAEEADEYVLPAEEDIVPTEDYLRYHREVYDKFLSKYNRIFCVGTKRRQLPDVGDPRLLVGDRQLCQPTCITKKKIQDIIVPLMKEEEFWYPPQFNAKWWSHLRNKPDHHIHHDGQLERMAEANDMFCLKPDHGRSGHIGLAGQHFGGTELKGFTYLEKATHLLPFIHDTKWLEANSDNPYDMVGVPEALEWDTLELDLDRDKVITQKADFDPENTFKEYICQERKS